MTCATSLTLTGSILVEGHRQIVGGGLVMTMNKALFFFLKLTDFIRSILWCRLVCRKICSVIWIIKKYILINIYNCKFLKITHCQWLKRLNMGAHRQCLICLCLNPALFRVNYAFMQGIKIYKATYYIEWKLLNYMKSIINSFKICFRY